MQAYVHAGTERALARTVLIVGLGIFALSYVTGPVSMPDALSRAADWTVAALRAAEARAATHCVGHHHGVFAARGTPGEAHLDR
jgi:hypothetical protein